MQNSYEVLPEGYAEAYVIDVQNNSTGTKLNIAAFVITVVCGVIFFLFAPRGIFSADAGKISEICIFLCAGSLLSLVYIVLHELVHGLAYRILTHHKLKFGISLTCAYCGVPDIYVSKKTALIAVSAPFIIFSVIFLGCTVAFAAVTSTLYVTAAFLFSIHAGGCAGDLYVTYLLLSRFGNDETVLMLDTGPKQTFYVKK